MQVIPSSAYSGSRRSALIVAVMVVVLTILACDSTNTGGNTSATDTPSGPTPTIDLSFTETFDSLGN